MAVYKVIQDIEAEDKLVGPLSLRQFIYGAIAAVCGYLSFIAITKGVSFFLVVLLPPFLFAAFFAFPWGRDQPTEVWALAKIRFFIKPRRRIWDQSGTKDLVTVTAPKVIERNYTDGLSQTEVQSRLTALASTLDSRGWAVKSVNTNLYDPARSTTPSSSDRLIDLSSMPQEVSNVDVTASDDILDEVNNPVAQQLGQMVAASSNAHRQQIVAQLKQSTPPPAAATSNTPTVPAGSSQLPPPADYWFLNKPLEPPKVQGNNVAFSDAPVVAPGSNDDIPAGAPAAAEPTADEEALAEELKQHKEKSQAINYQHMKVIQPLGMQTQPPAPQKPVAATPPPVTPLPDPAKIELARNNDLNIATIARIANKEDEHPDEVVISLHNHAS